MLWVSLSVSRKNESQGQGSQGNSSQVSHPSPRYQRDFGSESLLLKSCLIIPPDERSSIHLGNVNILNAKTEEQLKEDRVRNKKSHLNQKYYSPKFERPKSGKRQNRDIC